jgi:hypothetical protein
MEDSDNQVYIPERKWIFDLSVDQKKTDIISLEPYGYNEKAIIKEVIQTR